MKETSGAARRGAAGPAGDGWRSLALRLVTPALFLAAALCLPSAMLQSDEPFSGAGLGPAAWPRTMLILIAFFAVIWLAQEFLAWRRGRARPDSGPVPPLEQLAGPAPPLDVEDEEHYSTRKAMLGLALIVAYGWALPIIGFPIATAAFMAIWCVLGGVRRALVVLPVSLLGAVVLLWVFMGAAKMPFPRGRGVFDETSVALLQLLGIY